MKLILKKTAFFLLTLVLIVPMLSSQGMHKVKAVDTLKLNTKAMIIDKGNTFSILVINATDDIISWSSENPDIATVDDEGVVTAVNKGSTNIIANVEQTDSTNIKQFICKIGVKTSDFLPETPSNYSYIAGKDILAGKYVVFSDNTSALGAFWGIQNINGSKIIDNEFTKEPSIITVKQSQSLVIHNGYAIPIDNVSSAMFRMNNLAEITTLLK